MATPTQDGQVSVDGLLLGRGTPYKLLAFNPWTRTTRADQQPRAWSHGSWSGREFTEATTVPMRIRVRGQTAGEWLALHQALLAAFRPSDTDVELRWRIAGAEYLMFGRPRLVDPEIRHLGAGVITTAAAFVALDPRIYAATSQQLVLTLPAAAGGLTLPLTFPVTLAATVTSGRGEVANAGTEDTGLVLRIDAGGAPLVEPRVSLRAGDVVRVLRFGLTLAAGQWLDVDTAARTVYLNGTASRRGSASGDWPLLPAGPSELAFDAAAYSAAAQLTATWRDTW